MKGLDREGDNILRSNFHRAMLSMLSERNFYPKRVLDIGCAGGLSTIKLSESFPEAEIIGIDLSPYMLSGTILYDHYILVIHHSPRSILHS